MQANIPYMDGMGQREITQQVSQQANWRAIFFGANWHSILNVGVYKLVGCFLLGCLGGEKFPQQFLFPGKA